MTKNPSQEGSERRSHPRKALRLPVNIGLHTGEHRVETVNVSESGVFCILTEPIPLFTKVKVSLSIPRKNDGGERQIVCEGVIVRQEEVERDGRTFFDTAVFFQGLANKEFLGLVERLSHDGD